MTDADVRQLTSCPHMISPPLFTNNLSRCGFAQPDQAATPSHYDMWLRPRPNTKWQDVENQRFIDLPRYNDESLDDEEFDEYESSDEDEDEDTDSSDEVSDGEVSDNGGENEAGRERDLTCCDLSKPEVADEGISGDDSRFNNQIPGLGRGQTSDHEAPNEGLDSLDQEDDVIAQFLEVMEDQDLHRDSIARLRNFFKTANLEHLEKRSTSWKGSRILLDDRNFSAKHFRPYPRSLTPKQLYDALRRQVRHFSHFLSLSELTNSDRGTQTRPLPHLKVQQIRYGRNRRTVPWRDVRCK